VRKKKTAAARTNQLIVDLSTGDNVSCFCQPSVSADTGGESFAFYTPSGQKILFRNNESGEGGLGVKKNQNSSFTASREAFKKKRKREDGGGGGKGAWGKCKADTDKGAKSWGHNNEPLRERRR